MEYDFDRGMVVSESIWGLISDHKSHKVGRPDVAWGLALRERHLPEVVRMFYTPVLGYLTHDICLSEPRRSRMLISPAGMLSRQPEPIPMCDCNICRFDPTVSPISSLVSDTSHLSQTQYQRGCMLKKGNRSMNMLRCR
jgi:hypothetical protein